MQSFQWGNAYLTGLIDVDDQHHRLVDIINQLGQHVSNNDPPSGGYQPLFAQLRDYAQFHFEDEEAMMQQIGLDPGHVDNHVLAHRDFLSEIGQMQSAVSTDSPQSMRELLDFLIHWLAYHILGTDQHMAAQVRAIEAGEPPAQALQRQAPRSNQATEPLLEALNGLFGLVSSRNQALIELNQSLEQKVTERTQALAEANRHLEELALTDVLTGLPNRRHAMRCLASLWQESLQEEGRPISCMMIDADHFKQVNDRWGHEAGDRVLFELARVLRHAVRNDDIVCRLGGDEFFILCPATDRQGACNAATQVLAAVNALQVITGSAVWHGSVSIGVAARDSSMTVYDELIKASDDAVYAAKRAGKNCVHAARD